MLNKLTINLKIAPLIARQRSMHEGQPIYNAVVNNRYLYKAPHKKCLRGSRPATPERERERERECRKKPISYKNHENHFT
jgi:hypothetical protein